MRILDISRNLLPISFRVNRPGVQQRGRRFVARDAFRLVGRSILPMQPRPVQTLVASLVTDDALQHTIVVRRWTTAAVERCRLCARCSAKPAADGQAVCVVAVAGPLAEGEAPLYSPLDAAR